MGNTTSDNPYLNYLNNYFGGKNGENPVCREERQYALFLYNKLLNMVGKPYTAIEDKKIFRKIFGLDDNAAKESNIIIKNVYYEVTFMRDFFYKEKLRYKGRDNQNLNNDNGKKKSFNHKLYKFTLDRFYNNGDLSSIIQIPDCLKNLNIFPSVEYNNFKCGDFYRNLEDNYKVLPKINYGSNAKDGDGKNVLPCFIRKFMRAMMNSKADLGIIYTVCKREKHLKFLECKYLSPEGFSKLINTDVSKFSKEKKDYFKDNPYHFILKQTQLQYYITNFICDLIKDNNKLEIIAELPSIIQFEKHNIKEEKDITNTPEKDKINDFNKHSNYFFEFKNDNTEKVKTIKLDISDLVPKCLTYPIFPDNE